MKKFKPRLSIVMRFTDHHVVAAVTADLEKGILPQAEFETLCGLFLEQLRDDPPQKEAMCQALAALLVGVAMSRLKMQKIAQSN